MVATRGEKLVPDHVGPRAVAVFVEMEAVTGEGVTVRLCRYPNGRVRSACARLVSPEQLPNRTTEADGEREVPAQLLEPDREALECLDGDRGDGILEGPHGCSAQSRIGRPRHSRTGMASPTTKTLLGSSVNDVGLGWDRGHGHPPARFGAGGAR